MKIARILLFVLVIGGLGFAVVNQQNIRDWYALRNYDPPEQIAKLADDTGMSDYGRRLFYISQPELNDQSSFNDNCQFPERTIVLGCYAAQRIYIYDVNNDQVDGIEEVTAAHEMLHAAYERLSTRERDRINDLLEQTFLELNDQRLNETIAEYEDADPSSVPNELHSILATEHRDLPAELEKHYSQFFNDRQKVVEISEAYEKVFEDLEAKIEKYDKQLEDLKLQITNLEFALETQSRNIENESNRLDSLLNNNQIAAYNAAVPSYNLQVNEYNSQIDDYQTLVDRHNDIVEKRNDIALEQNELVQSLDSKFMPIGN
ncbi:MAG: hypothetical protein R3313_02255 [Candidatus Saccharimonadales bacterium]|nr:hypothetical protein [Candidatus Saccharimonadales bacterium]